MDHTIEPDVWVCKRCTHESSSKSNLLTHLRKKKTCQVVDTDISVNDYIAELLYREYNEKTFDCQYCMTRFNNRSSKSRHFKTCTKKKADPQASSDMESIVDTLKEQNQELLRRLEEMENIIHSKAEITVSIVEPVSDNKMQIKTKSRTKAKIPKALKNSCWNTYIGVDIGRHICVSCNDKYISQHDFHCGHVIAETNGGSLSLDNLRPVCDTCNYSMGTMDMTQFVKTHFGRDLK
jgi:hypothetical protein